MHNITYLAFLAWRCGRNAKQQSVVDAWQETSEDRIAQRWQSDTEVWHGRLRTTARDLTRRAVELDLGGDNGGAG